MQLIDSTISVNELQIMSKKMFGSIVKSVVDVERGIMVVDAPMHCDQEEYLLEHGSEQQNLWGINFHPNAFGSEQFIEFDSMINLRPIQGNLSRGVDDIHIQQQIREIIAKLVVP